MPFVVLYCFEKKKKTVWVNQRNQSHVILMIAHVCWARIGRTERDMNNSHKTSMVFPSRKRLNCKNGGRGTCRKMGLCITCPVLSLQLRVNTSSSNSHYQVSSRGWHWNLLTPHWVLSHSGSCWRVLRLYIWWPVSSSLFLSPDLQILKKWFPGRKERGNSSEGLGFNSFSAYLHHASNLTREWGAGSERTP